MEEISRQNGWNEYSKLVIAELKRLGTGITDLHMEIQNLKTEINDSRLKQSQIDEIKKWKDNMDEIVSPTQLKKIIEEVQELKLFKNQALTIWFVVQLIFAGIVVALKFLF